MELREIYSRLRELLENVPDLHREGDSVAQAWVGTAKALVEKTNASDKLMFRRAAELYRQSPYIFGGDVLPVLRGIVQELELELESSSPQGAFIGTGGSFDAMTAVGRIFKGARSDALIIDPYLDETILTDFAVMLQEGVRLRLLSDAAHVKPSLKPAVHRWTSQYSPQRPVDARLSSARTLHDRLILIDGTKVWTLSQSFKDLAARSPASIIPVASDIAALKFATYESMWTGATSI